MASGTPAEPVMYPATWAASIWLALVVLAALFHGFVDAGPLATLDTWFAVWTGSLLSANILFVLLALAMPALWVLFGAIARAEKAPPKVLGKPSRWLAWVPLGLAFLFSIMGGMASIRAAEAPDGTEPPVGIDLAQLDGGKVPRQRVTVRGLTVETRVARFEQPLKMSSRIWTYSGFRPAGSEALPDDAPIRLFVEHATGSGKYIPLSGDPPLETAEGYLIENGLPDHARIVLERSGTRIASPHFLLRDGENGLRDGYQTLTLLSMIFAFAFGLVGVMVLIVSQERKA